VLSPENGSFASVAAQGLDLAQRDASTATSGPHDFAVRVSRVRLRNISVHRNPSNVRDDGRRPSDQDGMGKYVHLIWPSGKAKYFLFWGLDMNSENQK
jgi:hypothetical protein